MKFCVDCKHYISGELANTGQCAETELIWNLETGESRHRFAESERNDLVGVCGPEAALFQPREQEDAAA